MQTMIRAGVAPSWSHHMKNAFSLKHSLDLIAALIAVIAVLVVLQTFLIGKHYIIPTMVLFWAVLFGNLARYGLRDYSWAKQILFWIFLIFACHTLFALFFSVRYRELLGDAFVYVCGAVFIVSAILVFDYAKRNALFHRTTD